MKSYFWVHLTGLWQSWNPSAFIWQWLDSGVNGQYIWASWCSHWIYRKRIMDIQVVSCSPITNLISKNDQNKHIIAYKFRYIIKLSSDNGQCVPPLFLSTQTVYLHATKAHSVWFVNTTESTNRNSFQCQNIGPLPTESAFIWRYLFVDIRLWGHIRQKSCCVRVYRIFFDCRRKIWFREHAVHI